MEGEEIFGSSKGKGNLTLELEGDSHKHNHVNFSHPHVNHTSASSSVNIEEPVADRIKEDVEVLEAPCGDGVWHIERCPPRSHVQCFTLQKSTNHSCATKINTKLTSIGVLALTYSRLWF
jgi:hypothetical protein